MYKLLMDQIIDILASVIVAFLCRFRGKLDCFCDITPESRKGRNWAVKRRLRV